MAESNLTLTIDCDTEAMKAKLLQLGQEFAPTPGMLAAGVNALTCEFGGQSEHLATDYEEAAKRVFSEMLSEYAGTFVRVAHKE